jgi:hypothetical protein
MKKLSSLHFAFLTLLCVASVASAQSGTPPKAPPASPQATPSTQTPAPPAQTPGSPQTTAQTPAAIPAANPADVSSMDAIIAAVYDTISGPAAKKRDWDRLRSLFIPGARLIPTGARQSGGYGSRVRTVEEYIQGAGPIIEKEGFYEKEVSRVTETFGQIAHVFSTYETRRNADEPTPFMRGINSIQLMNDGQRWWIVTIFWQAEDDKTKLPEKYLKK